jgi:hypothetical protein
MVADPSSNWSGKVAPASAMLSPTNARATDELELPPGPPPEPSHVAVVIPATVTPAARSMPNAADAALGGGEMANAATGVPTEVKSHLTAESAETPTARPKSDRSQAADSIGASAVSPSPGSRETPAGIAYPDSVRGAQAHATSEVDPPPAGATSTLPTTTPSAFNDRRREPASPLQPVGR